MQPLGSQRRRRSWTGFFASTLLVFTLLGAIAETSIGVTAAPIGALLSGSGVLAALIDWSRLRAFLPFGTAPSIECPFGPEHAPGQTTIAERENVLAPKKEAWQSALGGLEAAKPYIQARLAGWPHDLLIDKHALPQSERELLWRLARDTWRGLDALSDRDNELPVDHVRFGQSGVEPAAAQIGDYANVTNIGLRLIAIAAAQELDFLPRDAALAKIRTVLETLRHLETHNGFFFNYYDTTSLERTSNLLSFVDSSWLTAGLMVVRMSFPELYEACSAFITQRDYGFFYDRTRHLMSHGYYVQLHARARFHYGTFYTEARLGSLIAIGKGDVPEAHWFAMARTYPPQCSGQTQTPAGITRKTVRGQTFESGYYEWNGLRYIPSWGGSMFEALMPTLVLDETQYARSTLGANDTAHAIVQRRYALEALGYPVWGLSPASNPAGDDYAEYGVEPLGMRGYPAGAVTPHAAALALSVTPDAAVANLLALAARYDLYGEYGFYDAVDPRTGQVAHTYLSLDQSMLFIALANHLKDHCIQKRFASDPIVQRVLPLLAAEKFFD